MSDILTIFVVAAVILAGATVSGTKEKLCTKMGGTYQASAPDQCPDGKWSNLVKRK